MRHYPISFIGILVITIGLLSAQPPVDTIIQYSEKTPAQWASKTKKWKEEKLYFSEFSEGTGEGVFKKPDEAWSTHPGFRIVTVRIVGKDSLLLKFRTRENWRPDVVSLGRCNASPHAGTIKSVNRKSGKFFDEALTPNPPGWHWELLMAWPWDTAFRDRIKPFGFFITFTRSEE